MTARYVCRETCHRCGERIAANAVKMGWPVATVAGEYVCPSCYGDGGYCDAGHVLPADVDSAECETCAAVEEGGAR
jgi:hypothetical protein